MKRILAVFAALFLAALLAAPAFGAGASTTATGTYVRSNWYKVTVSVTADDGDASIDELTISSTSNASIYRELLGKRFYCMYVLANHGGTEVSDNTDAYVYVKVGTTAKTVDLLGNLGLNTIDNTANQVLLGYAATTAGAAALPVGDTVTVVFSGNSNNDATLVADLYFIKDD